MNNVESKVLTNEFIKLHLDSLPDVSTCEMNEIERLVYDGFDSKAEERPATLTAIYLVFKKNSNKSGWELAGYHY